MVDKTTLFALKSTRSLFKLLKTFNTLSTIVLDCSALLVEGIGTL